MSMRSGLLCLAIAVAAAPAVRADIYKLVDENGVVHLSDRARGKGWRLIVRNGKRVDPARYQDFERNRRRFTPLIDSTARRFRLDRALVHAVVRAESAYDPRAVSRRGAVGLMQLMPDTARRYGVQDRRNPAQNLHAGVHYLRDLLARFQDVALALAAYNAGENAVSRYGNRVPPFPETRGYVRRVLAFYREMRRPS